MLESEICLSDLSFLHFPTHTAPCLAQLQGKGFLVGPKHRARDTEERAGLGVREIW